MTERTVRVTASASGPERMLSLNTVTETVDQSWSLTRITREQPPTTWEAVFQEADYEFQDIERTLYDDETNYGSYYPLKSDLFNAFHYTPLPLVKVVIIGQDPYPQPFRDGLPRATGMSFSVRKDDSIPSSLGNIFTELSNTVRGFTRPSHGNLERWARQGVLLLNRCLTVRPGQPNSHGDIWLGFVNRVLKAIAAVNPQCIFLFWGREAQKMASMVGERSIILEAAHPSGRSAHRGFFGCNHFNKVNEILLKQGKTAICWKLDEEPIPPPLSSPLPPSLTPVDPRSLPSAVPLSYQPVPIPTIPRVLPLITP
jgi:uracil-DNA glycosylase